MTVDDAPLWERQSNSAPLNDGFNTGTDGYQPRRIDKALLGGPPQRVGRFEYRYDTDVWTWSDTVARMHGYEPGSVEPTTELVLSHKHPDDLVHVKGLLQRSAAPFSSRHRIRTTDGDIRKVVVVGEAVVDDDGQVIGTRGFYIDITETAAAELHQELVGQLQAIVANREVIEQAKGMLMATYHLDSDAAFALLRWRSQELNVKVHAVAARVTDELPSLLQMPASARRPVDHFLMTLHNHSDPL